uniref:Putative neural cell adhesion molecule l1 n=1 Tax=Amblyomma triste TaxID=251400 RepID=A0A023G616_AMBTT
MAEPPPGWHHPVFAIFLLWITACMTGPSLALRMIEVSVPSRPTRGSTVKLECIYDLEGDALYSVKWYKDQQEFFRFVPMDRPTKRIFRVKGLTVNQAESSESSVVLNNVQHSASGRYTCEVSADAPSFALVSGDGDLRVTEQPLAMDQPPTGVAGGDVRLSCPHDLGDVPLYSFKWYKDDKEFYRFVPRNRPPGNMFTVEGVTVDMLQSNYSSLYLKNLSALSAGTYRCEASSDAPPFLTVQDEKMLTVSELREMRPHITTDRETYQLGDTVRLNCTSSRARPAPKLALYIDDRLVDETEAHATVETHRDGFQAANFETSFPISNQHARAGAVRVKCHASFAGLYEVMGQTSVPVVAQRVGTYSPPQQRQQQRPYQHQRPPHTAHVATSQDECLAKAVAILTKVWAAYP